MELAQGVKEMFAQEGQFASPEEAAAFWMQTGPGVPSEDLHYPGGAGQSQSLRLYRGGDGPTLLYVHGGGWVGGSIDLHDPSARGMAAGAGVNVVSISYRLAPADPYPAALEDVLKAASWIEAEGPALGLTGPLVIGGASAGGNLAAAAVLASDPGRFAGLLVYYGVLGADLDTASYRTYLDGPGLTRARMEELFAAYDPQGQRGADPLITPLGSPDLGKLPPTLVVAAEHDVLAEENRAFAEAVQAAGVETRYHVEPGVTHGFINRARLIPAAERSIDVAVNWLKNLPE